VSLFERLRKKQTPDGPGPLRDRVEALEDSQRGLKRRCKALELEWETAYDKIYKAMQRLNKRARDLEKLDVAPGSTNDEPVEVVPTSDLRSRVLKRRRHA